MKRAIGILLTICTLAICLASCKHEHEWSSWQVEKPASVLSDGLEYRVCECGERETRSIAKIGLEKALSGKWTTQTSPDSVAYVYLLFDGKNVRYGVNLFGSDIKTATWNCTYRVDGTTLTLTAEDGEDFVFTIQDSGSTLRIFDDEGDEYLYVE